MYMMGGGPQLDNKRLAQEGDEVDDESFRYTARRRKYGKGPRKGLVASEPSMEEKIRMENEKIKQQAL